MRTPPAALGPFPPPPPGDPERGPAASQAQPVPFTCPRCSRASHHPEDARQGYCGACRDWTASEPWVIDVAGVRVQVVTDPSFPPGLVAFGAAVPLPELGRRGPLADSNTLPAFITGWPQDPGEVAGGPGGDDPDDDGHPWNDAAAWHPGYPEW